MLGKVCVFLLPLLTLSYSGFTTSESTRKKELPGFWSSGVKTAFGTAYESYDDANEYSEHSSTAPLSKVWFTAAQGVLTEVFWPTIDMAQTRDHQILVTDGHSFFWDERTMAISTVTWIKSGVPAFKILNRDASGRFEIERTLFADPDRDVVLQKVRITKKIPGLKFYIHHNPSAANTPFGDNAIAGEQGSRTGVGLFAWQADAAQAMICSIGFKKAHAGKENTPTDGFTQVKETFALKGHDSSVLDANVVLTAELNLPDSAGTSTFDMAVGFAHSVEDAQKNAWDSLNRGINPLLEKYTSQWIAYSHQVRDLAGASLDKGELFRASLAVMKSLEDKTYAGAYIASPSVPWGLHQADWSDSELPKQDRKKMVSGYHIVWPRDLYQMATSFLAIDDAKAAIASLNYLRRIQYNDKQGDWKFGSHVRNKDGSFPQNCWINGENHWGGVQLDEVAMPIVLAYRLWRGGHIKGLDYWDMVRRAADFIADFGPWSPQERWEEIYGLSPSTIASEIAALRDAAYFAEQAEDWKRVEHYRAQADLWSHNLESWMFTTSGKHGNGRYYERIEGASSWDQVWNPNDEIKFNMANGSGLWREKDVVDGGFLELVRFGVRRALSYDIQESLPEYDATIRVDYPGIGPSFRRYLGDRYNYDEEDYKQTLGMPWPLLTGERGHYELAAGVEKGLPPAELDAIINPYIFAMEKFTTESQFIPEQVWDYGTRAGKPTGAATPLGWAHGEYVKILRSRLDRQVFDLQFLDRDKKQR